MLALGSHASHCGPVSSFPPPWNHTLALISLRSHALVSSLAALHRSGHRTRTALPEANYGQRRNVGKDSFVGEKRTGVEAQGTARDRMPSESLFRLHPLVSSGNRQAVPSGKRRRVLRPPDASGKEGDGVRSHACLRRVRPSPRTPSNSRHPAAKNMVNRDKTLQFERRLSNLQEVYKCVRFCINEVGAIEELSVRESRGVLKPTGARALHGEVGGLEGSGTRPRSRVLPRLFQAQPLGLPSRGFFRLAGGGAVAEPQRHWVALTNRRAPGRWDQSGSVAYAEKSGTRTEARLWGFVVSGSRSDAGYRHRSAFHMSLSTSGVAGGHC